ncbi:glycosyltransferase family 4 protein [Lapillicoccus jejuensis]|uniref:D-inositol 3-phosphate glycosyltransferase n=1 Tax=Lapillicoccus jejuensis TaxID=402171 RepID=A0A542DZG0_9MICO|nr:glycosyltransferase family 4 protein [Lapillicoccus jejuensis]TQJ08483.1 glycosyltransferase involved in cell wall biosynthesis [Lapillicoccus jejuensis]
MSTVHLVVPQGVDDPRRPSGGNTYDRRLAASLTALGRTVVVDPVPGPWPGADVALEVALGRLPDGAVAVVDGLLAGGAPFAVLEHRGRLRLVVIVHLPLGVGADPRSPVVRVESAVLAAVDAVVTTSRWTARWLETSYGLEPHRVRVALPGADRAPVAPYGPGGRLLCVGAVTAVKGQDVLLDALARLDDRGRRDWSARIVGSTDVDPAFAEDVRRRAAAFAGRVTLTGPLAGADLDAAWAGADLLVVPSRVETYGLVVTEALGHGVPVLGSAVGGLPEALGTTPDGRPGTLVPAGPDALATALLGWLTDAGRRTRWRDRARRRRDHLAGWDTTAHAVDAVLADVAAGVAA